MAVDAGIKAKVLGELALGAEPKELSEKYDLPYVTINSWKKKQQAELGESANVQKLVKVDKDVLQGVVNNIDHGVVQKKAQKLVDGVVGLQQLEPKFLTVVQNLLEAAEELSMGDLTVKDWATLSNGIGSLYSNIFNKAGVNVNVMNQTTVNSEKVSLFKSQLRD